MKITHRGVIASWERNVYENYILLYDNASLNVMEVYKFRLIVEKIIQIYLVLAVGITEI